MLVYSTLGQRGVVIYSFILHMCALLLVLPTAWNDDDCSLHHEWGSFGRVVGAARDPCNSHTGYSRFKLFFFLSFFFFSSAALTPFDFLRATMSSEPAIALFFPGGDGAVAMAMATGEALARGGAA